DTVGFVRDLPHELVAAFRSTLSEAREADLLLHVIDASDPLRDERAAQVDAVLGEIGAGGIPQLLVFNKIDRLGIEARHDLPHAGDHADAMAVRERVWISARDGAGLDLLREALARRLGLRRVQAELRLPPGAGRLRARLHDADAIRAERHDEDGWTLAIDLPLADARRLAAQDDGAPLRPRLPPGGPDRGGTAPAPPCRMRLRRRTPAAGIPDWSQHGLEHPRQEQRRTRPGSRGRRPPPEPVAAAPQRRWPWPRALRRPAGPAARPVRRRRWRQPAALDRHRRGPLAGLQLLRAGRGNRPRRGAALRQVRPRHAAGPELQAAL